MVKIVNGDDAGYRQLTDKLHELHLMMNVQMVGRFIQQDLGGRLRQRAGDMYPLTLAAG